jgi:hypothetical protein
LQYYIYCITTISVQINDESHCTATTICIEKDSGNVWGRDIETRRHTLTAKVRRKEWVKIRKKQRKHLKTKAEENVSVKIVRIEAILRRKKQKKPYRGVEPIKLKKHVWVKVKEGGWRSEP